MKSIQVFRFLSIFVLGSTISFSAYAVTYTDLLKNVIENQPAQNDLQSLSLLQSASENSAKSLFAGGANLVLGHENDALTGHLNKRKWQVGAQVPLWLPGEVANQNQLAQKVSELHGIEVAYLKWQASSKVRTLVWQLKEAKLKMEVANQSVIQIQTLNSLVSSLVKFGEKPKIDSLLAQKTLLSAQSHLISIKNQVNTAQSQYQYWTKYSLLPNPINESLTDFDTHKHPALLKLKAELDLLKIENQRLMLTEKDNPTLSIGGFQEEDKAINSNTSVYAQITYPLQNSAVKKVNTANQLRLVNKKLSELQNYKKTLQNKIFSAEQEIKASREKIVLVDQAFLLAKKTLKLAKQTYRLGETNIQTLVNAQHQFLESKLQQALTHLALAKAIANRNQIVGVSL